MFILDKPYISEFLQETAVKNNFPTFLNPDARDLELDQNLKLLDENTTIKRIKEDKKAIYCNSENAISWIANNLKTGDMPEKIELFKDKAKFRRLISKIYPDFFFEEIPFGKLKDFNYEKLRFPVVLKPSVGFLSFGVYIINNTDGWIKVVKSIDQDVEKFKEFFPKAVVDTSNFIIEEMIEGEEYAADVYFDKNGQPIILNIYKHPFASGDDVSDRAYFTSKEIIETWLNKFEELFKKISDAAELSNFPAHIELRVKENKIIPIEVNPMRFAGWCLCDLAYHAFGINVYEYYFNQIKPDWNKILNTKGDELYYFVVADVPKDVDKSLFNRIDYEAFAEHFSSLLELRKINYNKHPLFACAFAKTDNYDEILDILKLDLKKFMRN